jgi:hypothetical protein
VREIEAGKRHACVEKLNDFCHFIRSRPIKFRSYITQQQGKSSLAIVIVCNYLPKCACYFGLSLHEVDFLKDLFLAVLAKVLFALIFVLN